MPDLRALVDGYIAGDFRADDMFEKLLCLYRFSNSSLKNAIVPFLQYPHKCMYDTQTLMDVMRETGFLPKARKGMESAISDIESIEQIGRTVDAVIVESLKPKYQGSTAGFNNGL